MMAEEKAADTGKRKHLVLTCIEGGFTNTAESEYQGEFDPEIYPVKVSFLHHECLVVPFWFDDESDARNYAEKANGRENREFLILQEFTYKDKTVLSEAKIVGVLTCPGYPSFEESDTERRPGVWAHVRTIFVCDRGAAKDYLTRFNEDCAAAYEINQKMITQRLPLGKAYTSRTSPGGFCLPRRWRTR